MKILENAASKVKVPEDKRDILVFDESLPGFGIRKFASGKASFVVKYQLPGGRQRKVSRGPLVPGVAAEMRRKASDILARARLGQDVVAEKQAASKRGASIGELIAKYLGACRSEVGSRITARLADIWSTTGALCTRWRLKTSCGKISCFALMKSRTSTAKWLLTARGLR